MILLTCWKHTISNFFLLCRYVAFWLAILAAKFSFTNFLQKSFSLPVFPLISINLYFKVAFLMQIKPLVNPTRKIISFRGLEYAWHDCLQEYIFFPHTYAYALFYFFVSPIGPYNISLCCVFGFFWWSVYLFPNINVLNLNPFLKFLCVCCDYVLDVVCCDYGLGAQIKKLASALFHRYPMWCVKMCALMC